MAPMLRTPRRRRRTWATPFVVTFALAGAPAGCSKNGETTGEPLPPNPPNVDAASAIKPPPLPPDAAVGGGVVVPPPGVAYLGDVTRNGDACEMSYYAACDPGEKCNPPAPKAVPCPAGLAAGASARVMMRGEVCEAYLPDGCPKTDPAPPCNPPEPVTIDCP